MSELSKDIHDLMFAKTLDERDFYRHYQNLEDNGENIISTTPDLFVLLGVANENEVHCDATLKQYLNTQGCYNYSPFILLKMIIRFLWFGC